MNTFDQLRREHDLIRLMLGVLGTMCDQAAKGRPVPAEDFESALEFFDAFVDQCHHAKEELHLFAALEGTDAARPGGQVGPLLAEHKLSREYIKRMTRQAVRCAKGERAACKRLGDNVRLYAILMDKHIRAEEEVLFPLAQRHLGVKGQADLVDAFAVFDQERTGLARHQEFHDLAESLRRLYPPISQGQQGN